MNGEVNEGNIYVSKVFYKCLEVLLKLDFDFSSPIRLSDKEGVLYEFVTDDNTSMFFPPPRRHELEIIEKHLSLAGNIEFLSTVKNPSAIFWFVVIAIKKMS